MNTSTIPAATYCGTLAAGWANTLIHQSFADVLAILAEHTPNTASDAVSIEVHPAGTTIDHTYRMPSRRAVATLWRGTRKEAHELLRALATEGGAS